MSLFTKIIDGEIPSYKIFEDDLCIAILDIKPIAPGHLLIIPKKEVDHFQDLEEPYYSRMFAIAKKISPWLLKRSNAKRIGLLISGYGIPHVHLHLIPTRDSMGTELSKSHDMTHEELTKIQQELLTFIS